MLEDLLARRILFVTGKGGVGKSTVAAAVALLSAQSGRKTLLIDTEAKGDAASFLDAGPAMYQPKSAGRNLWQIGLGAEEVMNEYLRFALKIPGFYRIGPLKKIFDFIATAAPGVREALIAGKVGFEHRSNNWDSIIVDAAPSGQILSHLRGPKTFQEMVPVGLIRNQTDWVLKVLEDPSITGIVVVTVLEEMPVTETTELIEQAPSKVSTPVLGIVINRVIQAPEVVEIPAKFGRLSTLPGSQALKLSRVLASNQQLQRPRLAGLRALEIPLLVASRHDLALTTRVASALA